MRAFSLGTSPWHSIPHPKTGQWRSGVRHGLTTGRPHTTGRGQAQADRVGTSILDDFASQAEGTLANDLYNALPFTAGLAYDVYGINPVDPTDSLGTSYVAALPAGAQVGQSHTIDSHGATSNTSFFWSGNYMDRFYLGLSIGIIGHRHNRTTTHSETTTRTRAIDQKDMRYQENLSTSGNGIDVGAGFVDAFVQAFPYGAGLHSPMWTQLNDAYTSEVGTNFEVPIAKGARATPLHHLTDFFNYRVQSPWRLVASAAYIAGDHGLFSVDYEYADYGNARFRPSNRIENAYDFEAENETIKSSFRGVHTVRAGTEWRSGNWYFRLGWALYLMPTSRTMRAMGKLLRTLRRRGSGIARTMWA
ncbi:MAG: hypothetical protein IPO87_19425 [Flavobacteriales bacterium]|nr:hypothetical protein [Flavobacteriales bacterium]